MPPYRGKPPAPPEGVLVVSDKGVRAGNLEFRDVFVFRRLRPRGTPVMVTGERNVRAESAAWLAGALLAAGFEVVEKVDR